MELTYTIRPVQESELETIAEIEKACFPALEAAGLADFKERFKTCQGSFFVAEKEDGTIMGFCNGCSSNSEELTDDFYHETAKHDPDGKYQMIFGLDTLPAYQGHGVGRALMLQMIKSAKQRGKKAVILTCKEHMIPFYEKIGYQWMKKADSSHGGAVWYKMVYTID
ncbi:MAG: GNAT family N-acetyltransferase [Lachnospiraceae bacterium]|nr:GNAT family N-acetyltransferase [Lachnospiraceae bacterium]